MYIYLYRYTYIHTHISVRCVYTILLLTRRSLRFKYISIRIVSLYFIKRFIA